MPGTPLPAGNNGPLGPWWNSIIQALQQLQQDVAALKAGQQQTVITDQYGNAIVIVGQLDQIVTIGASHGQAGVQVGTGVPASGQPNAGLAVQQGLVTTTITTTEGSTAATIGSSTGIADGMVIGAADVTDPASGTATPAITPGTTISAGQGTTSITLSENAAESGSGIFCAACYFWVPGNAEPWLPVPLAANFANYGSGYQTAACYKDISGIVHVRGLITNSAGYGGGTTLCTLPSGYRPGGQEQFNQVCYDATTGYFTARFDVNTNGTVVLTAVDEYTEAVAGAVGSWFSLAGISFDQGN